MSDVKGKYYLSIDGKQEGPFTFEELKNYPLTTKTQVWTAESGWSNACDVEELVELLPSSESGIKRGNPTAPYSNPPAQPSYGGRLDPMSGTQVRIPPKNWLVESILVTLFCCLPLGIVGIINAVKVNDMVQMGNYDLAEKYSNDAKKWINWGVIISLGIIFIYFIIAMIAAASI